jgi:S-adenosylmethionine decarboxylase
MNKEITGYGPHLTLDLNDCECEKLGDMNFIFQFLQELPEKIGMEKITEPYVVPSDGAKPGDEGITGVVLISESHISVHTYMKKKYVFIDIFSCRHFDWEKVKDEVILFFGSRKPTVNCIIRGKDFPS